MKVYIKAKTLPMPGPKDVPPSWQNPVGWCETMHTEVAPMGWLPCEGQSLLVAEHIELFGAIGFTFSPTPFIDAPIENGFFRRLFGLKCKTRQIANPDFDPKRFNVPDFRSHFVIVRKQENESLYH